MINDHDCASIMMIQFLSYTLELSQNLNILYRYTRTYRISKISIDSAYNMLSLVSLEI
jgi:hypothetical protein